MDANSSYHKVYVALTHTTTWRQIIATIEDRLDHAKVESVSFTCRRNREDKAVVTPAFVINYGEKCEEKWGIEKPDDLQNTSVSISRLWSHDDLRQVIDTHFGPNKDVKTRNCRIDILKDGKYKQGVDSFYRWASVLLEHKYDERIKELNKKLQADCVKVLASDTYAQALRDAEIKFCKDNITAAMMQWRHMPDAVLREAWDQFIATVVMEE